jgi:hypothetical protein
MKFNDTQYNATQYNWLNNNTWPRVFRAFSVVLIGILLSVNMLNDIVLSVINHIVTMLNVVAPIILMEKNLVLSIKKIQGISIWVSIHEIT